LLTVLKKINEEENAVDDFNFVATIRAIYEDDDVNFTDADFDVGILPDIGDITADDLLQGVFPHVSDDYAQPDDDAPATLNGGVERTEAEGDVATTTGPSPSIDATTQTGVAVVDASTSANEPRRHFNEATQTHRDGHQFLPDGITLKQLAQMLFEAPIKNKKVIPPQRPPTVPDSSSYKNWARCGIEPRNFIHRLQEETYRHHKWKKYQDRHQSTATTRLHRRLKVVLIPATTRGDNLTWDITSETLNVIR
jgi:hypothetical protein